MRTGYAAFERVYQSKTPRTAEKHIGIEIEFFAPIQCDDLAKRIARAGLATYVNLGSDGSVYPDCVRHDSTIACGCTFRDVVHASGWRQRIQDRSCGRRGFEARILVTEKNAARVIRKLCGVLQAVDAGVNRTCGLHVHLDMRSRMPFKAFENLSAAESVLFAVANPKRRENEYCEPIYGASIEDLYDEDMRHKSINPLSLLKHRTIEVRVLESIIDADLILAWIRLLSRIADAKRIPKKPTVSRLIRSLKISKRAAACLRAKTRENAAA